MQNISDNKKLGSDTVQNLKEINSQSLSTQLTKKNN